MDAVLTAIISRLTGNPQPRWAISSFNAVLLRRSNAFCLDIKPR